MTGTAKTAEDWGRLATRLQGWRWVEGMTNESDGVRLLCAETFLWKCPLGQHAEGVCAEDRPDPDDLATAGCLLMLLGPGVRVWQDPQDSLWTVETGGVRASMHKTLGRACVAAAAAVGQWSGGAA